MKTFGMVIVVLGIILLAFYSCGDKGVCGDHWFINKTGHKINADVYCYAEFNNQLSFPIAPLDSINRRTCGMGGSSNPFTSSTCRLDSILVVFNDTLSLNTFKYLEYNPMNLDIISKTKFRYEFTEAHYQKALEVNGYLK